MAWVENSRGCFRLVTVQFKAIWLIIDVFSSGMRSRSRSRSRSRRSRHILVGAGAGAGAVKKSGSEMDTIVAKKTTTAKQQETAQQTACRNFSSITLEQVQ